MLLSLIVAFCVVLAAAADSMPAPFTRELYVTSPKMTGNDVIIAQNLLKRDKAVDPNLATDGVYGQDSAKATAAFQSNNGLPSTGTLDSASAQKLLDLYTDDKVTDTGFTAASMGYMYKVHIPVHNNRSVETYSTLYDKNNKVLLKFKTRTHGHRDSGSSAPWPDYGVQDVGYTQFGSSGNTVTGLVEIDLNSPEPDPQVYGPWPVNRIVRGLEGNAQFMLPNIRDGLLIHTGNWTTEDVQWKPSHAMPDSSGCVHAHPEDVERIYKLLLEQGVKVNDNTFSGKNYPYKPQGVAVIELID